MIKLLATMAAKEGLSLADFRDHYDEIQHAPLALKLFPMIRGYRRNYLERGAWFPTANGAPQRHTLRQLDPGNVGGGSSPRRTRRSSVTVMVKIGSASLGTSATASTKAARVSGSS